MEATGRGFFLPSLPSTLRREEQLGQHRSIISIIYGIRVAISQILVCARASGFVPWGQVGFGYSRIAGTAVVMMSLTSYRRIS